MRGKSQNITNGWWSCLEPTRAVNWEASAVVFSRLALYEPPRTGGTQRLEILSGVSLHHQPCIERYHRKCARHWPSSECPPRLRKLSPPTIRWVAPMRNSRAGQQKSRVPVAKVKNEPALRNWKKLLVRVMRHDAGDGMYHSRAAQAVQ
jgi:hypothetical protein